MNFTITKYIIINIFFPILKKMLKDKTGYYSNFTKLHCITQKYKKKKMT